MNCSMRSDAQRSGDDVTGHGVAGSVSVDLNILETGRYRDWRYYSSASASSGRFAFESC